MAQAGGRNYWWPDYGYGTALSNKHGLNKVLWDRHMFCKFTRNLLLLVTHRQIFLTDRL